MSAISRFLFGFGDADWALLVLRVMIGFELFRSHGIEKLTRFGQMSQHFPDPLHIGPASSLAFALVSDAICSLLVALGLVTRVAALIIVINTGVAFFLVHHMALSGQHSGELAWVYGAWALGLVIAGPGRFSVDAGLRRAQSKPVRR